MKKVKLALIATTAIFCFACGSKTEADFSIVPIMGSNEEYQYIDVAQNGKIVINPQFGQAHIFRDGLALVRTSGKEGKWGYIDKKGKFIIAPVYNKAQDFNEGVAWVQLESQPPMLIDKKGKMILQLDSLIAAYPFNNGIAGVTVFSQGQWLTTFIDKKGKQVATTMPGEHIIPLMNDGIYLFRDTDTKKWGSKNKNGDIVINAQFDDLSFFIDGMATILSGNKWGAIDKSGSFIVNPQYDSLIYDGNGLFAAKLGKKWGWINKKNDIVINPQFDMIIGFNGDKLAPVQMGEKWAYIDKTGQIVINPQFAFAFGFNGKYAMVVNIDDKKVKAGFIDKEGKFAVPPMYEITENSIYEYTLASGQNSWGLPLQYLIKYLYPSLRIINYQSGDFDMYSRLEDIIEENRQRAIAAASGSFTDPRDNKTYKTIKIGSQTWMSQNLNYIGDGYVGLCYGDRPREQIRNPENCEKYGRLYDWSEAMGLDRDFNWKKVGNDEKVQGICPKGWHLPNSEEWQILVNFAGGNYVAGTKLKARNGWSNDANGTDDFGFAALPSGFGDSGWFRNMGVDAGLWTATEYNGSYAYRRAFDGGRATDLTYREKSRLMVIRCVKD